MAAAPSSANTSRFIAVTIESNLPREDRGRDVELEQVVRQLEEVHQEGQRHLGLGEVARDADREERRIAPRTRERVAGQPGREGHEQQGQQLPGVREVEQDRDQDLGGGVALGVQQAALPQEALRPLHEDRQHDERVVGHERGQQRVPRDARSPRGSGTASCAVTRSGSTQKASRSDGGREDDEVDLEPLQRVRRSSCPAVTAPMAKTPTGVSRTTNVVMLTTAAFITRSGPSRRSRSLDPHQRRSRASS